MKQGFLRMAFQTLTHDFGKAAGLDPLESRDELRALIEADIAAAQGDPTPMREGHQGVVNKGPDGQPRAEKKREEDRRFYERLDIIRQLNDMSDQLQRDIEEFHRLYEEWEEQRERAQSLEDRLAERYLDEETRRRQDFETERQHRQRLRQELHEKLRHCQDGDADEWRDACKKRDDLTIKVKNAVEDIKQDYSNIENIVNDEGRELASDLNLEEIKAKLHEIQNLEESVTILSQLDVIDLHTEPKSKFIEEFNARAIGQLEEDIVQDQAPVQRAPTYLPNL